MDNLRHSLRFKLSASFAVLLGVISTFVFLFFPATAERRAMESLEERTSSIGAMAAHSVRSALVFDDRTGMEDALRGTFGDSDVLSAELIDPGGRVLLALRPEGLVDETGRPIGPVGDVRGTQTVHRSITPVLLQDRELGSVRLEFSLRSVEAEVSSARRSIALVSLSMFLAGLTSVLLISGRILRPLKSMIESTLVIAAGDLSHRATVSSNGEAGQLATAFNHMLDRLDATAAELASSKQDLEQILDNVPAEVTLIDRDMRLLYMNPMGSSDAEERKWSRGKTLAEIWGRRDAAPEVAAECECAVRSCIQGKGIVSLEQTVQIEDHERHLFRVYAPILRVDGSVERVIGYAIDTTDRKRAEEALNESEERLRQAQKMESIGRLAGGIAHDFNNLLTAISGHAELLSMELDVGDVLQEDVKEIRANAARAAVLTRQLLAYSRKQVLQPRLVDMGEILFGIEPMLRRLIGEDVDIQVGVQSELPLVRADPGQIEQVVMNLSVNARDAMPDGGLVKIEAAEQFVEHDLPGTRPELGSGSYVTLTVSDNGIGMDDETQSQIFEPFYTTKGPTEGTGLGLATVIGIVEQSDGAIHVYSEVGLGTTFKFYLPAVRETKAGASDERLNVRKDEEFSKSSSIGSGTILLVEDQASVRNVTRRVLERCGYRVLVAEGPRQALALAADFDDSIDLLLTDVVMPEMSGPKLAAEMTAARPGLPVLYMSGYSDDALSHRGILDDGVALVEKPFDAATLQAAVERRLEALANQSAPRHQKDPAGNPA